ncbi:MAG: family 78 glycoside hydrolase catalytic domain [Lentisphaeria bacterium]|nr:family 78 glycoside hydrolase catalytic domain [Lentisphaeria bacterium]
MTIVPVDLQIDARKGERIFLASGKPEFSWRIQTDTAAARQSAFRILAEDDQGAVLWDSGIVQETACRWIPWGGAALASRMAGTARVQIFDQSGNASDFSEPVHFETALLENRDWGNAHWIWYDRNNYSTTAPSPYFRRTFCVRPGLHKARLYITARGCFNAYIDGMKISPDYLAPGWTDFRKQIPFMTYDLTKALSEGIHTLGAVLSDGWCCGNLTIFRYRNTYHPHPELLARLELTYDQGEPGCIVTDSSWKSFTGSILSADLYDGEDADARLEMPGWCKCNYDDKGWIAAADGGPVQESPLLVQKTAPPVRCQQILKPVQLLHPKKDICIWDFGQNFTGTYRVRLRGTPGRLFTFQTGEMLDNDGTLYTLNYRSARSRDSYICSAPLEEWCEFSPSFTFHGFRYLQIDGYQFDKIPPESLEVTGLVLHSDMQVTAEFLCGNPLVSRLWLNALWGQRSNFLEIPMDCPQRDERLGWTGDAQIFATTAMYNADCCTFYRKYLRDIRDAMQEDGAAPSIAPAILRMLDGAAAWGDAIVLIPYALYRHYGWKNILVENYAAMKRSIAWQKAHSDAYIRNGKQFGDWLAPVETPLSLVATAYFVHCARCLSEIAGVLGQEDDQKEFSRLFKEARAAFQKAFVDRDGIVSPPTQTALALGLVFDIIESDELAANAVALEKSVRENGTRLNTGFIGTALLLPALVKCGLGKTACDLVLQEEYPSWLYSVKQGATTIWERWESFSREKGFADASMNSFNHYAYGTVASFLTSHIGGIHYSHEKILLQMIPDERFSPVQAAYDSPHGKITSQWEKAQDGQLSWRVLVPGGIPATAILPDGTRRELPPGTTVLL